MTNVATALVLVAALQGRYVELLAVSNDYVVSVVHDLTPEGCVRIVDRMYELNLDKGYRTLDCVPIDYEKANRR